MQPRFLITGCGRSGTGYVATLLSELGLACGHEAVFRPAALLGHASLDWPASYRGESSWLAAPYLANLPADTLVVHQVREPVAVVRSFRRIRFFEEPSSYRRFAEQFEPGLARGSVLEKCMLYWLAWNQLVERALAACELRHRRQRLEDLDLAALRGLLAWIGCADVDPSAALARHPRDYNSRGSKQADGEVRWETLPQGELLERVRAQATRYGYGDVCDDGTLAA